MVTKSAYIPDAGDIVWLGFDPQAGHEQAGHRPALVLTLREYNKKSGLMICCPITTKIKNNPFEVAIPKGIMQEPSAVLVHHVKTMDFMARNAKPFASVPYDTLRDVKDKLAAILEID